MTYEGSNVSFPAMSKIPFTRKMDLFLNVSLNLLNSVTNIFVITVKGVKPVNQPSLM